MQDKPGEESTHRAAPRGKPTPVVNRRASALGAGQAKTLTRGSLNIVVITAMSTIGAAVYNLTSQLVGGVEVTLRETE